MAKQLNVNLAFTASTDQAKAQLKDLQQQLSSVISSATLKQWEDPNFRNIVVEANKKRMSDPAEKEKIRTLATERMKDPAYRQMASEGAKKQWEDPAYREKRCKKTTINGKEYNSLTEALENENIPKTVYYSNLKKGLYNAE